MKDPIHLPAPIFSDDKGSSVKRFEWSLGTAWPCRGRPLCIPQIPLPPPVTPVIGAGIGALCRWVFFVPLREGCEELVVTRTLVIEVSVCRSLTYIHIQSILTFNMEQVPFFIYRFLLSRFWNRDLSSSERLFCLTFKIQSECQLRDGRMSGEEK